MNLYLFSKYCFLLKVALVGLCCGLHVSLPHSSYVETLPTSGMVLGAVAFGRKLVLREELS